MLLECHDLRFDTVSQGFLLSTRCCSRFALGPNPQYFTIDGKILEDVNDDNYLEGYRDKLLYISGKIHTAAGSHEIKMQRRT